MNAEQDYEQIGRVIYGAHRLGLALALLMERMGKAPAPTPAGEPMALAQDAREADAMFARLPASDDAKAEFAALMQTLLIVAGQLDQVASLDARDAASCAASIASAQDALPRFGAMVDELRE